MKYTDANGDFGKDIPERDEGKNRPGAGKNKQLEIWDLDKEMPEDEMTEDAAADQSRLPEADEDEELPAEERDVWATVRSTLSTIAYLAAILIFSWLFVTFIGQRTVVDGRSMEPTLSDGDNLIVDKISYRLRDPERFDIIVFPVGDEGVYYIKRIIGLPGETVQIGEDGTIYIDGEPLDEDYGLEVIWAQNRGVAVEPVTLGEDEYFVMGDNRNNSSDSRNGLVGNIKREDIVGRAWLRVWPISDFGLLKHGD